MPSLRGTLPLLLLLSAGCGCLPPLRTNARVDMAIREPLAAKIDANLNTLPERGALQEVPVPPYCGGQAAAKVAVIDVDGLLLNRDPVGPYSQGDNPLAVFHEKLLAAAADPAVKAVVLRINSPGGSVAATEMMWRALIDFRQRTHKPVIACLLDLGAGGGYYLASGCDQIVAAPASVIGGIGVMLNLYYLEIAMEQWNVFGAAIKAGERIDMGSSTRKMTAEEKSLLTTMAKEYHANFRAAVLQGRPQVKADAAIFDGRVMTTAQALQERLVDAAGHLPDAIDRARQMTGAAAVTTVMYRRCGSSAHSVYDTVPNRPTQGSSPLLNLPGIERCNLPLFLYLWQVEPTVVRVSGPY
jgi:protease-4